MTDRSRDGLAALAQQLRAKSDATHLYAGEVAIYREVADQLDALAEAESVRTAPSDLQLAVRNVLQAAEPHGPSGFKAFVVPAAFIGALAKCVDVATADGRAAHGAATTPALKYLERILAQFSEKAQQAWTHDNPDTSTHAALRDAAAALRASGRPHETTK